MSNNALPEWVRDKSVTYGLVIPGTHSPSASEFVTPSEHTLQVGYIVYGQGKEIVPHVHQEVERRISRTSEVLLVRKGRMWVDFYTRDREYFCSRQVAQGDIVILIDGGHGFRMIEDTVILEVKQGPFVEGLDKTVFRATEGPASTWME